MARTLQKHEEIERSIIKKYRKTIWNGFVGSVQEYELIKPNDKIAVCISGGKDSMLLAKCMQEILRHGKMEFGLKFLVMDPGYRPENRQLIEENAKTMGIPVHIFESDIFDVVKEMCSSPLMISSFCCCTWLGGGQKASSSLGISMSSAIPFSSSITLLCI